MIAFTVPAATLLVLCAIGGLGLTLVSILRTWPLWSRLVAGFVGFSAAGMLTVVVTGLHPGIALLLAITCTIAVASITISESTVGGER